MGSTTNHFTPTFPDERRGRCISLQSGQGVDSRRWHMCGWAVDSCRRWMMWLVLCEVGRGLRVGDISMSWSAAPGGSRCSEVACETRLCRSWPGIAGSPFLDGWVFSRCSSSTYVLLECVLEYNLVFNPNGNRCPSRQGTYPCITITMIEPL